MPRKLGFVVSESGIPEIPTTGANTQIEMSSRNVLAFRNCTFKVPLSKWGSLGSSGEEKEILHNICGEVRGGTDMAIMGPSGSGKTTLLNLLSLVPSGGTTEGYITLNGHSIDDKIFRTFCAYLPQEDHLWPFLTCREILMHAADFHLNVPYEAKRERVDSLISQLGLEKCRDTVCGNQFLKGLSGGQKRRLSLGLALIKEPAVLFLDEPTSGLDSAAAAEIMAVVKEIVHQRNIIVLCTIHQPSTAVFYQFDSVMLLSGGSVAYCGSVNGVVPYFTDELKKGLPPNVSPPEFILDLVNSDFGGPDKRDEVSQIVAAWKSKHSEPSRVPATVLPNHVSKEVPLLKQIWMHLRRQTLLSYRDPTLYISRMAIFLVSCILFAWVYDRCRERRQDQVTNRMFLCVWFIAAPSCMGAIAVFGLNLEFQAMQREIKNGMYSPWSYIVSNTILQVPCMVLLTLSSLGVAAYGIADFQGAHFGQMIIIYGMTLWAFEMMAQATGLLFHNPLVGMLLYINLWFLSFLFAGFFIPEQDVDWPLKVLVYVLPFRWGIASIVKTEFRGATFHGATAISDPPPGAPAYTCGNQTRLCFGRTGEQVLESLSQTFTLFEPSDTFAIDVLAVFGIGAVFKVIVALAFYLKTRNGHLVPKPQSHSVGDMSVLGSTELVAERGVP